MIVHITMDSKNFEGQYFNAAHVEVIMIERYIIANISPLKIC